MSENLSDQKEIKYLRFIPNTLQAEPLSEDICDEFTRKIFAYVEDEPRFDPHVFCALLSHFIHRCKLHRNLVMTAEHDIYAKSRFKANAIANKLSLFLDLHTIRFALPGVEANYFRNISIEEKLKHLLDDNESSLATEYEDKSVIAALSRKNNPSWKWARVKIVPPEIGGNTRMVPYFDLEFTLPRLSVEQKLDIIHFAICALNYLSQTGEPELVSAARPNPIGDTPLPEMVARPEHLKVVSDNLDRVRTSIIKKAITEKETYDAEQDKAEFAINEPTTARILKAQKQDRKIEKQWLDGKLEVDRNELTEQFGASEEELFERDGLPRNMAQLVKKSNEYFAIYGTNERHLGQSNNEKKTQDYPPSCRKRIIDAAVRLSEKFDEWTELHLVEELRISKSTLNRQKKFFNLKIRMIRDEAQEIIRAKET